VFEGHESASTSLPNWCFGCDPDLGQTATTPAIPPVTDPLRGPPGIMWDTISREQKDALDTHSHLPVRNGGARERIVCRHEPLRSVVPLATSASARRTSSTPNRGHRSQRSHFCFVSAISGVESGDRWKAQYLSRLLGGRFRRHAHANTLNNVPSHERRH
jgi:hypothetical protein